MDLSYTQNMEDTHLWAAFGGRHQGTYIDIGAGHPIADNVSFFFYERGWRGVAVEPQANLVDLYARLRPRDIAVAALIGTRSGETDFHVFEAFHGLSTTDMKHAEAATALGAGYRTVKVPMLTLAELCRKHKLRDIDFLKVDVEGAEADVLKSNDWKAFRPKAVVVEAIAPGSNEPSWQSWEPFLLAQGYGFMLFDTLNRFYVAEEAKDVAARFPRERAPWDSVRHMYEIGRAPENASHPEHALTRILGKGFWAVLPYLDRRMLADILERGRTPSNTASVDAILQALDTEDFRARLGRIACGYDGGQIYKEDEGHH
jgi:FkbM family methyltransferase